MAFNIPASTTSLPAGLPPQGAAATPAGMVFVPSRAGLSHVPGEWTSASDIARGVEVLRRTVVRLDALLASLETPSVDDVR